MRLPFGMTSLDVTVLHPIQHKGGDPVIGQSRVAGFQATPISCTYATVQKKM